MTIERTEIRLPSGRVIAVGDEVRPLKRQGAPLRTIGRIVDDHDVVRFYMRDGGRPVSLASLVKDYVCVSVPAPTPTPTPAAKPEQVPLVLAPPAKDDSLEAFLSVRRAIQAETRLALCVDVLRCARHDLPHQVDEMVRERIFSREGLSRMSAHAVVRETAAILATWLERGAP